MTLPSYDGPSEADQIGFAIDPRGGSPESLNRAESPAPEGPTINVPSKSTATKTVEERRREVA